MSTPPRELTLHQRIVCCIQAVNDDVCKDPTSSENLEQIDQKVREFKSGGKTQGAIFRAVHRLAEELKKKHEKEQADLATAKMWLKCLLIVCLAFSVGLCVLVWTTFF